MSSQSKEGVFAVSGTLLGLATAAVVLRLFARKKQRTALMADDVLAVTGLASYITYVVITIVCIHKKTLGYASTDFTKKEMAEMAELSQKLAVSRTVFSILCLALIKLSALFFYRRIFCVADGLRSWFDIVSRVTIVIVVSWMVVFEFLIGFECGTHFSALWDGTYLEYCTITFPYLYATAVSDFLLDIWILIIPIPRVLQLRMSIQRKLATIGVFMLGFVGLGASIARMVQYIVVENGGPLAYLYKDLEEDATKSVYFTVMEMGISLVAVNLPSLWLLFKSITPGKILRSIRSVLSFASFRSTGADSDNGHAKEFDRAHSMASLPPSGSSSARLRTDVEAQKTDIHATTEGLDLDELLVRTGGTCVEHNFSRYDSIHFTGAPNE